MKSLPRQARLHSVKLILVAILVSLCFMVPSVRVAAQPCGIERWDVKTLTDSLVGRINFQDTINSSVRKQTRLQAIKPSRHNRRMNRVEMKFYRVKAWLIGMVLEKDRDYHLVLKDLTTDSTMVIEIPDPDCAEVAATPWAAQYREARNWISDHIRKPSTKYKELPAPVQVVVHGVGFYDRLHGQHGMAWNGRELHPVMSIGSP